MDNYVFDMPENIRQIVEAMRRAGTQGNQPQQEPPTPAQYVDEKVRNGVDANIAADAQQKRLAAEQAQAQAQAQAQQLPPQAQPQAQPQPEQPLLDPLSHDVYRRLVDAKSLYGGADAAVRASAPEGTSEEALQAAIASIQGTAHQSAEDTRRLAERLGVDMTGYGSDVSLEDAQRNLQTRETREIADILSGRSKYGQSADQYFDDVYMRMIGEGASPSQAKRWAGRQAQQYQAERVTYLRNAFNMFGRDGNYVNDQGVPILQEIAQEMPQVANIYAQAYKLPTAAQDRLEKLVDTNMFANQFLRQYGLGEQALRNNITLYNERSRLQREEEVLRSDTEFQNWAKKEEHKGLAAQRQFYRQYDNFRNMFIKMGLSGAELNAAVTAAMGIKLPQGQGGMDSKSLANLKDVAKAIDDSEKNVLSQLKEADDMGLSDKEIQGLKEQLAYIREKKELVEQKLFEVTGISGAQSDGDNTSLNKDIKHDLPVIQRAYADITQRGYSHEKTIEIIRKKLERTGYAGTQIELLIGSLAGG